jgi:hypothetical protein
MLGQDPRFRFASGGQCARGFRFGVGACLRCLGGTRFFGKRLGRGGFRRLVGPSLLDKLLRCFRFRFRASRRLARQPLCCLQVGRAVRRWRWASALPQ